MLNFFARSGPKIENIDSLCSGRGQARLGARVRAAATYDVVLPPSRRRWTKLRSQESSFMSSRVAAAGVEGSTRSDFLTPRAKPFSVILHVPRVESRFFFFPRSHSAQILPLRVHRFDQRNLLCALLPLDIGWVTQFQRFAKMLKSTAECMDRYFREGDFCSGYYGSKLYGLGHALESIRRAGSPTRCAAPSLAMWARS